MVPSNAGVQAVSAELPAMPLTLEGLSVLHQMFRFRWPEWRKLDPARQADIAREAAAVLCRQRRGGQSAVYSMLGHKGDLMLVHFRDSFDELNAAELQLNRTGLQDFLEPTHSYLSVIELGLYDSSVKLFRQLTERGMTPLSEEWNREVEETMERQRQAMRPRLIPRFPTAGIYASIRWTASAAKTRTGTRCPSRSASGRWKSTAWWAVATRARCSRSSPAPSASTIGSGAWICLPPSLWCSRS